MIYYTQLHMDVSQTTQPIHYIVHIYTIITIIISTVNVSQTTQPIYYLVQIVTNISPLWMCPKPHNPLTL